jgi:hypothetical protein
MIRESFHPVGCQFSSITAEVGTRAYDDQIAARLVNAPAWVKAKHDRWRETRGLPPAFGTVRTAAATAPAAAKRAAPPAKRPLNMKRVRQLTKNGPRAYIICCPGVGNAGGELEQFGASAWDLDTLNGSSATWALREGHYGGNIDTAESGRLKALIHPRAGLLVEWKYDDSNRRHMAVVESIMRGRNAVSVAFLRSRLPAIDLPSGKMQPCGTTLDHVAILQGDDRPAYPGASAWVTRAICPIERARALEYFVNAALERAANAS